MQISLSFDSTLISCRLYFQAAGITGGIKKRHLMRILENERKADQISYYVQQHKHTQNINGDALFSALLHDVNRKDGHNLH